MEPEELKTALDAVIKNDFYLPEIISGKIISGLPPFVGEISVSWTCYEVGPVA